MRCVTVALHHQALTAWAEYRIDSAAPPELLTLDFHTDVLDCRRRGVPEPAPEAWRDVAGVAAAVEVLHHDEQIDWALRGGFFRRATVAALAPEAAPPEHPALTVRRFPGLPPLETMLNRPEEFRPAAERVFEDDSLLAILPSGLPEAGFVLDIDCDCVLCRKALTPERSGVLTELFRRAGLVTLSREEDWVRVLKLPGETLTGAETARKLEEFGRNVVGTPDL